jgi:hypothetical protein
MVKQVWSPAGWRPKRTAARVFVLWGQSNVQGYATSVSLPGYLLGTLSRAYIWRGAAFAPLSLSTCGYPDAGNDWGPELRLAYLAAEAYPREAIYIVKHAVGATPLTPTSGTTWNPNVSGSLYTTARGELGEALAALSSQGLSPVVQGFLWGQGERDAGQGFSATAYEARQFELFDAVRAYVGDSALPITDMLIIESGTAQLGINNAKRAVKAARQRITLVDTTSLTNIGDNLHLDGAAQLSFAASAFAHFR